MTSRDGFLARTAARIEQNRRRTLEAKIPDAQGRWDAANKRGRLAYLLNRDGGCCGLCAGEMPLEGGAIDHIIPKVFAVFDIAAGKAEWGIRYTSKLHGLDNLQAAHIYCQKRKGNTPRVSEWRHPAMPPMTVAGDADGATITLPKPSTTC